MGIGIRWPESGAPDEEELLEDPEGPLELSKVPGCEMLTAGTESRLGGESLFLKAMVGGVLRKAQS